MNILVHIDSKMGGQPALRFLRNGLAAFAKNQPGRQLFLSASKSLTDQAEWMAAGFQILRVTKPAFPLFSGQIFRSRLSRQVRKLKIDCCLIINGSSLNCPGTTQFLVPLNIAWKPSPHDIGNAHIRLLALAPPQSMETSSFSPERISYIPYQAPADFQPLSLEEKLALRSQYAAGQEYFLYAGPLNPPGTLVNLLKAFSVFKKWQASSWKLILTGNAPEGASALQESLATYKYRNDVLVLTDPDPGLGARLIGAAYALVIRENGLCYPFPAAESLACGVPLIAAETLNLPADMLPATLQSKSDDFNDLGEAMKQLYRDEALRARLAASASARTAPLPEQAALELEKLLRREPVRP